MKIALKRLQIDDPVALVQRAIALGLMTPPTPRIEVSFWPTRNFLARVEVPAVKLTAEERRRRQIACAKRLAASRKQAGLRVEDGKPRVNAKHPSLAGLCGREYHTAYMRLIRANPDARTRRVKAT